MVIFLVGLAIGWLAIGWYLWPVQYYDTDPQDLRLSHKEAWILMVADSYSLNQDHEAAQGRLQGFEESEVGEIVSSLIVGAEEEGDLPTAQRLRDLAGAAGITLSGALLEATPTPTLVPTSTATPTATATAIPTATPTATPIPTPEGPGGCWMSRPIGPDGEQHVDRFYPYGSTGGGMYRIHHGVEFINQEGTPVLAAAGGTVIVAGWDDEVIYGAELNLYGQLVIVELENKYRGKKLYNLYAHLSQIDVEVGQVVEEGDTVGRVGMSGATFAPHLHFEVRVGENTYDRSHNPELWLCPLPGYGTIVGRLIDAQGKPIPQTLITVHHAESPEQRWQDILTYPLEEVNPDEEWRENFVLGDAPEGTYILKTMVGGKLYQREVVVVAGEIVMVIMETG